MPTPYKIPFTPATPQDLSIPMGGKTYRLKLRWNVLARCWVMDVLDQSGSRVLLGVPLVTGDDLLRQFKYLDFGGALVAQTTHDLYAVPMFDNLGDGGNLYFVTP